MAVPHLGSISSPLISSPKTEQFSFPWKARLPSSGEGQPIPQGHRLSSQGPQGGGSSLTTCPSTLPLPGLLNCAFRFACSGLLVCKGHNSKLASYSLPGV